MRRFLIRFLLRLLVVFAVVLGGLLLFRSHYRPLLRELAETQIKNATSDLTNDALTELLARDSVAYDRIVYFEKDLNGRITAMKTNILEVNRMKTEILESSIRKFWTGIRQSWEFPLAVSFSRSFSPGRASASRYTCSPSAIPTPALKAAFSRPASTRPCIGL